MSPKTRKFSRKRRLEALSGESEKPGSVPNSQYKRKCSPTHLEKMHRVYDTNGDLIDIVPKCIMDFYIRARDLCPSDPCAAFSKLMSARLVGLFDLLSGSIFELSEEQRLLHYRHATDLPEMQTVLLCEIGRYCLWRDIPNGEDCLILYVPNDNRFPKIELVGNNMEHAIVHLSGRAKVAVEKSLSKPINLVAIKKQIQKVCAERNKKKLGHAPNGAGLWVQVTNDIGYRPISEDAVKIKKMLNAICDSDEDSKNQQAMQWLMEIIAYVQMANDEYDFGMGLELGYWLFLANHQSLDKLAYNTLCTAYTLLEREGYKKILDLQMSPGVRRRKELDARKY